MLELGLFEVNRVGLYCEAAFSLGRFKFKFELCDLCVRLLFKLRNLGLSLLEFQLFLLHLHGHLLCLVWLRWGQLIRGCQIVSDILDAVVLHDMRH